MSDDVNPNSIYTIARKSPGFSWPERAAVDEADVEAALGAGVPGGSHVYCWLPMEDGHTIHQTARDVVRAAIAAVDKRREQARLSTPSPDSGERIREAAQRVVDEFPAAAGKFDSIEGADGKAGWGSIRALAAALEESAR